MNIEDPVRVEIDKAASVISTACRLLGEGRRVDLSALEGKVQDACHGIAALPVCDGQRLLPDLEDLMAALDRLSTDLDTQHRIQYQTMGDSPPDAGRVSKAYAGSSGDPDSINDRNDQG